MKLTHTHLMKKKSGMTLIELTVVILVLLALISVLFVGARAYIKASDKTACIMNQRNIQQACRSYFNLNPTVSFLDSLDTLVTSEFLGAIPTCNGLEYFVSEGQRDLPPRNIHTKCPYYGGGGIHTADDLSNW